MEGEAGSKFDPKDFPAMILKAKWKTLVFFRDYKSFLG